MIGQKGLGIMKLDKQTDEQARMKVNCANVSSALTQKVKGLEGEVFGEWDGRDRRSNRPQ